MAEFIDPVNLAPVYCISSFSKKENTYEYSKVNPANTNSLIITIITKYVGDLITKLPDGKFIAMETEIENVLTKYRKEIEMESKRK